MLVSTYFSASSLLISVLSASAIGHENS